MEAAKRHADKTRSVVVVDVVLVLVVLWQHANGSFAFATIQVRPHGKPRCSWPVVPIFKGRLEKFGLI